MLYCYVNVFFKKQNVIKNLTRFFTELRLFYVTIMINM